MFILFFGVVAAEGVGEHGAEAVGKRLRLKDLDRGAETEQVGAEVDGGTEVEGVVGPVVALRYELLTGMEREVAEVVTLQSVDAQTDALGGSAVASHDAETFAEEALGVEVAAHLEVGVGERHLLDAVEGVDNEGAGVARRCAVREMGKEVPTLVEEFEAVGLDVDFGDGVAAVATVANDDTHLFLHGVDNGLQVVVAGNLLEHDAVLDGEALANDVVDGQRGEHPVLDGVFVQQVFVLDEVAVVVAAVAVDEDAEDGEYGVAVTVEGGARQLGAVAHLGLEPFLLNLWEGDTSCPTDGADYPDVFFEQGGCGHGALLLYDGVVSFDFVEYLDDFLMDGGAFGVIGKAGEVDTVFGDELLGARTVFLVAIDGDGVTSGEFHEFHARDVGLAVAEVYHAREGNGTLLLGDELVDAVVVAHLADAFVDFEDELRLGGVVHRYGRPVGYAVNVVEERAGVDGFKLVGDGGAFYHLFESGGVDVVVEFQADAASVFVDEAEPFEDAREEFDHGAEAVERLATQRDVVGLCRLEHLIHIAEDAAGVVVVGKSVGGGPELFDVFADGLDEAEFLHVFWRQRAVEVVD